MKRLTKLMLTLALLAMGVTGAKAEDGTKTPLLLLKNGAINTTDFDITPIAPSTLEAGNLYAATFTSKGGYCNTFKYENLDVSDYDKAVVKYTIAEGNGDWEINLPDGKFTALSIGTDQEYEISLDGVDSYGDFTVFSWNHSGKSITISEVYLFKSNEPQTPVDRWLVYDGEAKTNSWDKQAIYDLPTAMVQGKTYIVKADIKSENGGDCALWPIDNDSENKNEWGGSNDVQYCASYTTTTTLTTYTWEFEANHPHDRLQFVFGKLDGKIYFDNVSCKEKGTDTEMVVNGDFSKNSTTGWSANWNGPTFALEEVSNEPAPVIVWTDIIVNGDMEDTSAECFYLTEQGVGGPYLAPILEGVGKDGSKGVKVESYNSPTFDWDTQFFIRLPYQLPAGTKYKVSFDYKATKAGDFDTQAHAEPSQYIHWSCIGSGSFTTAWKTFEKTGTVPSECDGSEHKDGNGNFQYYNIFQSIAFNLGKNKEATKFYFDNIKFEVLEEVANTLPPNPKTDAQTYPETITSMAIVGDLTGGWPTNEGDWSMAKPMTQDAEDDAVWTLTINNFTPTKKRYEYKAAANNNWNRYVLPNGDNAYIDFDFDDYPSVKYNLTFTANTKTHNLDLEAVKVFDNMVIVGDFLGLADETANFNPNNGWEMTQSTENPAIWTYTTDFTAAAETYRFKAVGDKSYDYYQLPKEGNTTKQFGTEEYPTGNYELTFTVNTKENSLTLDAVKKADTYTVAGSPALFGSDWNLADANNELTQNADGTYSITYTDVALSGNVEYKVVKDNDYAYGQWPAQNRVIGISMAGTYDITINFNPADGSVWETMAIAKEITAAGYATYCSPYALNFENTGVEAYFAKKEGSNVTFYEIFNAPANTGLLLKADKGTYKLKMETVEGEAAANVDGNVLIGVNEQTVVDHSGIFVLLNGDKGVGFYKTTAESFTVGANTAYIDAIAGARSFIGFDDNTTTAIEGVATVKENNGEIYNLQGQRVTKAQKGLYIINGKKVLVK